MRWHPPWLLEEDMERRSPLSEYMPLHPSLTHNRNINPFENKVWEIYFYKEGYSFVNYVWLFPLIFVWEYTTLGWQRSTTSCLDDNVRPHVARMTMFDHKLLTWHRGSSLSSDFAISIIFSWSFAHRLPFSKHLGTFYANKKLCSKEVETSFEDFLTSKA